jgi:hypothetical protein
MKSVIIVRLAQIFTLAVAVAWIYWPAVHGGWIWDDNLYITKNSALMGSSGLVKIWFVPGTLFEYYPITETLQWFQWQLFGHDTFGYHLTNLILHLLNACLLWRLLSKLGLSLAWMGALLFAIHPMNVETVAWISELKNTLSLAPSLLCVHAFIIFEDTKKARFYWHAFGLFCIAMLCKNSMVCLPFWLLLYVWRQRGRLTLGDLTASAPFFLFSIFAAAMTMWAAWRYQHDHGSFDSTIIVFHHFSSFFVLSAAATFFYLQKFIYPFDLVAFYPPWGENATSQLHLLQMGFFCLGALLLFQCRFEWRRNVILGFGFFFFNLLPLICLIFAKYPFFIWSLDHSSYLPFLGLIGLTVAGLEQVYKSLSDRLRTLSLVAVICLALPIAIYSRGYASCFVDAKSLWIYTLQHSPSSISQKAF